MTPTTRVVSLERRLRAIQRAVRVLHDVTDQVTGYSLRTGGDVIAVAYTGQLVEESGERVVRLLATLIRESVAQWPTEQRAALERALETVSRRDEATP